MAIKKGLAVVDSAGVVVHKLLDDGSVELGKTGSEITFGGTITLGVNNDGQELAAALGSNDYMESRMSLYKQIAENEKEAFQMWQDTENGVVPEANWEANKRLEDEHSTGGTRDNTLYPLFTAEEQDRQDARSNHLKEVDDDFEAMKSSYADIQGNLDTEVETRNQDFGAAEDKTMNEMERVNALMVIDGVLSDIDTFGEVVEFLNQIDVSNDAAREQQFNTISSSLETETAARGTNHGAIMSWSLNEFTDRASMVSTQEGKLQAQVSRRQDAVASLQTVASDANTTLSNDNNVRDLQVQKKLNEEIAAQVAGDGAINSDTLDFGDDSTEQFGTSGILDNAIGQEVLDNKAAKAALTQAIQAEASAFATANSQETGVKNTFEAHVASELLSLQTLLTTDIAAEKAIYESDDNSLSSAIDDAESVRENAFNSLSASILTASDSVSSRYGSLVSQKASNTTVTAQEYSDYSDRVSGIENNIDALISTAGIDANQFHEIVTYLNSEDSDTSGELTSKFNQLASDVDDEEVLRINADNLLDANLAAEEAAMAGEKVSMQTRDGLYATELATRSNQRSATHTVEKAVYTAHATARQAAMITAVGDETSGPGSEASATTGQGVAIGAETTARGLAINTEVQAATNADDAMLQTLSDFLSTGFSGANVTVNGATSLGSLTVGAGGKMSVVEVGVPAGYITGDQSGNNGKMFYLNAGPGFSAQGPFVENNKWYFCEMGTWHMSPFYSEDS
jgi:hypothetical protein